MDEIVIRLRPKHLERLIFVLIIIVLSGIIFWQRVDLPESNVTGLATQTELETVQTPEEQAVEEITAESSDEDSIANETAADLEPVVEPETDSESAADLEPEDSSTPTALPGRRKFTISDIDAVIKNEESDWGKLKNFNLKIENGLAGVYITYNIYIYDDNDGDIVKNAVQETVSLRKIEEGEIYESVQEIGESFNDIDETKTLKVVFQDSAGSTLDTYIKTFKAS